MKILNYILGAGLLPVEQWEDKTKAEWLGDKVSEAEIFLNIVIARTNGTSKKKIWYVYREDDGGQGVDEEALGIDKDFSQALTNAVITVAEEQGMVVGGAEHG